MPSTYAEQIGFASGILIGTRTDVANATPQKFGILQDAQVDFTADLKQLHGQGRYAIALAPGKTKIEIKAKFAGIRGAMWNDLYFGETTAATQIQFANSEAGTIPGTPYAVTVTNAATFATDQGVFYTATGQPLKKVASAPATGQYSVSAVGVYTFAAADTLLGVLISYTYTSATGIKIPITNQLLGVGPSFSLILSQGYDGRTGNYIFNACKCSKLNLPTKQDDFTIFDMDIMASADAAGNIGSINLGL